jgi:ABC-type lipoprotein release transport system permease subunit
MALGADRASVLRMIILEGLALTLAGVVIGALLALALTRALASYLYGVSPSDPLTYLATTLILTVVALLASYFPARRAAGVRLKAVLRTPSRRNPLSLDGVWLSIEYVAMTNINARGFDLERRVGRL